MSRSLNKIILDICIVVLLVAVVVKFISYHNQKKGALSVHCFQTQIGWGYEIDIENKKFIYQPFIPVISKHKGFPTKEMAERTGQLIIGKLKNHEKPIITITDLKQIGLTLTDSI
jgi:hypothetical protein